jgi:hypothetical protein
MNNPFDSRKKTVVIRTKAEAEAALRQHRKEAHGTEDLEEFFDCSACGVLERRLSQALDVSGPHMEAYDDTPYSPEE